jgi:type VI secretion system protein ImpG
VDPRLLKLYEQELLHVREMAAEFARANPRIAGRLALGENESEDPHVERLIEAFAFLAARVHLRLDAEFPKFTRRLLELVYPHYLGPTPAMAVVELAPQLSEGSLAEGVTIPRNTALRTRLGRRRQSICELRTAHDVTLWPLEVADAHVRASLGAMEGVPRETLAAAAATFTLRLRATAGLTIQSLALDALPVFLRGVTAGDPVAAKLYELLLGHALAVVVREPEAGGAPLGVLGADAVAAKGFRDEEALLPVVPRSFQGYRLLHEYFAFPARFLFAELRGLRPALARAQGREVEIVVLLDRVEPYLESAVDARRVALFCTPAVNLFPKTCDRIHLDETVSRYHVVPDRTRPYDHEVWDVGEVTGYGTQSEGEQRFLPFYALKEGTAERASGRYFVVDREPSLLPEKVRREIEQGIGGVRAARAQYVGHDLFVSLVDANEAPISPSLRQLGVTARCTNRHLPLLIAGGEGGSAFTIEGGAPVDVIRCLEGPTRPRPSYAEGEAAWRLLSHLSLGYESLADEGEEGAAALREILKLYADLADPATRMQIDGVRSVATRRVVRRAPVPGPIAFARGLEVTLTLDEQALQGSGPFLMGAVLEQFIARYVSINSFTETLVRTDEREVMRWPPRTGRRPTS